MCAAGNNTIQVSMPPCLLLCLQASAARAALEAEQALVSQLKEEASISAAASAQLLSIEQQVHGMKEAFYLAVVWGG
jgi:hypothetical protein